MTMVKRNRVSQEQLNQQLRDIEKRLLQLDIQQDEAELERKQLSNEKAKLETNIDGYYYVCDGIRVTEHSILRYLERVRNIDVDMIVEEMLFDTALRNKIKTIGSGQIPMSEKTYIRVIDRTVITILNKESKDE